MKNLLRLSIFFAILGITVFTTSCSSGPEDPREALLKADMDAIKDKSIAQDSIVSHLKNIFKIMANGETNPENFNFMVKENADKTKLLVLIRIPKLHKIRKEDWSVIIEWTAKVIDTYSMYSGHDKYYGLMGDNFLNGAQTPVVTKIEKMMPPAPMLPFYGETPATPAAK